MNNFILLIPISMAVVFINFVFAKMNDSSIIDIIKVSIFLLPIQFLVGIGYAFYYANGIKYYSYATLAIASTPTTIALSLIISSFIMKNHIFNNYEIIGSILTFFGLILLIIGKTNSACGS